MAKKPSKPGPEHPEVEIREDGQRHLVRKHSAFKQKAAAHCEETKQVLADRHEEKMNKVRFKKSLQEKNGWPSDKSPI